MDEQPELSLGNNRFDPVGNSLSGIADRSDFLSFPGGQNEVGKVALLQFPSHLQALPKQVSPGMLRENIDDLVIGGQQLLQVSLHVPPPEKFIGGTGVRQFQIDEAHSILDPILQIVPHCLHFKLHPLARPAVGQIDQGKGDGADYQQKESGADVEVAPEYRLALDQACSQ